MYHKHHTRGIILAGYNEGENGRCVNILTEDFGLIWARAIGVRKIFSKLRSGAQDFWFGEFSLIYGKTGWKLVSTRTDKNFFELLKHSSVKISMMQNIFRLIRKLVGEDDKKNKIFEIVLNFLNFLIFSKESESALVECLTLLRILNTLGFLRHDPELVVPISVAEIGVRDLAMVAARRAKVVSLINESLKVI